MKKQWGNEEKQYESLLQFFLEAPHFPNKIKYRREGDDYAVYCSNTHSVILINPNFFNLVKDLYSRESFTIKNLAEELGDKDMVRNTINFLNTRGLIC